MGIEHTCLNFFSNPEIGTIVAEYCERLTRFGFE